MATRPYPILTVNERPPGHPGRASLGLRGGDTGPDRPCENGDLVDVVSQKGRWLGTGLLNDHSKIRVRLLSRNTNDRFDEAFWRRRLQYALDYRKTVMGDDFSCARLIFGEADQFPGLTVDLFGDILVTEVLSLGMEVRKSLLYSLLVELLAGYGVAVRAIYERNEAPLRDKEGLPREKGFYPLPGPGHRPWTATSPWWKTGSPTMWTTSTAKRPGFFWTRNTTAGPLRPWLQAGGFWTAAPTQGLSPATRQAGAAHVTAVDISQDAVALTRRNVARNGLEDRVDVVQADVFSLLTELAREKKHPYDYIILDPPAFTKSGATVKNAYRGYKEINLKAMKLLPRGGYLATCSCSPFHDPRPLPPDALGGRR